MARTAQQYDRGQKWEGYQGILSLTDYVLVSQAEPRIEHFCRDSGGTWTYRAAGPGGRITLTSGAELRVDAVFSGMFDVAGE